MFIFFCLFWRKIHFSSPFMNTLSETPRQCKKKLRLVIIIMFVCFFALFKHFFSLFTTASIENLHCLFFLSRLLCLFIRVLCVSIHNLALSGSHKDLLKTNKTHKLIELSFWFFFCGEQKKEKKKSCRKISSTAFLLHVDSFGVDYRLKVTDLLFLSQPGKEKKGKQTRHQETINLLPDEEILSPQFSASDRNKMTTSHHPKNTTNKLMFLKTNEDWEFYKLPFFLLFNLLRLRLQTWKYLIPSPVSTTGTFDQISERLFIDFIAARWSDEAEKGPCNKRQTTLFSCASIRCLNCDFI